MPLYDYACTDATCGASTETSRRVAERHDAPCCPRCGGSTALLVSAPLIVFRGAGWSSPTTQDRLRARSKAHAARGHALPPKARRAIGPHARAPMPGTTEEGTHR